MNLYDLSAPAKLNLFLHVTGRRADGYHLIQSVFMLIDWCDTLNLALRTDGFISREDLGDTGNWSLPPDDLIVRAARALQRASRTTLGAHIGVQKRLPMQAGLGGGSSDAATCLLGLNRLWGLNCTVAQLSKIGLALGADVPFFLCGHNAWVEGIGERITPLVGDQRLPPAQFVVVKPQQGVETASIFSSQQLKRDTATATIPGFAANPYGFGHNDLQPVAQNACPEIDDVLSWLHAQNLEGRMSGSGSVVFAPLVGAPAGRQAAIVPFEGWQWRQCSNLDVHPLVGWASSDI